LRELVRTNNAVLITAIEALLKSADVPHLVLDQHMSVLEGSLGILPRRILVDEEHHEFARQLLEDAGLAHELRPNAQAADTELTDDAVLGGRGRNAVFVLAVASLAGAAWVSSEVAVAARTVVLGGHFVADPMGTVLKLFAFGAARYEDDAFSGFDYQATLSAGAGYKFIDSEATKFSGTLGIGYRTLRPELLIKNAAGDVTERIKGDTSSDAIVNAGLDYLRKLTANTQVTDKLPVTCVFAVSLRR